MGLSRPWSARARPGFVKGQLSGLASGGRQPPAPGSRSSRPAANAALRQRKPPPLPLPLPPPDRDDSGGDGGGGMQSPRWRPNSILPSLSPKEEARGGLTWSPRTQVIQHRYDAMIVTGAVA